jgi:hypothetical protein
MPESKRDDYIKYKKHNQEFYSVMDIDFVITWVDMNDPKWQADFSEVFREEGKR